MPINSHQNLQRVFDNQSPSQKTVYNWFNEFKHGKTTLEDNPHAGRPADVVTFENTAGAKKPTRASRNATYEENQDSIGIISGSV